MRCGDKAEPLTPFTHLTDMNNKGNGEKSGAGRLKGVADLRRLLPIAGPFTPVKARDPKHPHFRKVKGYQLACVRFTPYVRERFNAGRHSGRGRFTQRRPKAGGCNLVAAEDKIKRVG